MEGIIKPVVGGIVAIKVVEVLDKAISQGKKQSKDKFFYGLPKNKGRLF